MFIVRCDRCRKESPEVQVTTLGIPAEAEIRKSADPAWLYPTPKGWDRVLDWMLCAECVGFVRAVMKDGSLMTPARASQPSPKRP
jgi:hypothetical protein